MCSLEYQSSAGVFYTYTCSNHKSNVFSHVRGSRRLLCVPTWVFFVSVCNMYAVLAIKAPVVRDHHYCRRDCRYLCDCDLLRVLSIYERRRTGKRQHVPQNASEGPPSGIQKRHRRLADLDPGKLSVIVVRPILMLPALRAGRESPAKGDEARACVFYVFFVLSMHMVSGPRLGVAEIRQTSSKIEPAATTDQSTADKCKQTILPPGLTR